ncbi:MAG TPA: TetR/AcrR family transcriptional regulator [Verrucomicrobiae bacterium]
MKLTDGHRSYHQRLRAEAAQESSRRVLAAFMKFAETEWFEQIKLGAIAREAGVTVQTVIRKFGGKEGLLTAACEQMGKDVLLRRTLEGEDLDSVIEVLTVDYEEAGSLIMRLLQQEDRHPALKQVLEVGRRGHREWLAGVFQKQLASWPAAGRAARLDALVAATDLYLWRLLRVDLGRSVAAYKATVKRLLQGALAAA